MYLRQHPTYRRLSARLGNKPHPYSHSDGIYQAADANYYATAKPQGQRLPFEQFATSNDGRSDEQLLTSRDFINWERIGRGGFGKVYRAQPRDSQLYSLAPDAHGFVAIKVVDKKALKDSAAEMRLATEVAIHESLAHPSVVHIYDSFEDDRFVYLVMEYCERTDLWRYLRQRHIQLTGDSSVRKPPHNQQTSSGGELAALNEPETRYVIKQVAAAVAYLHSNGVLHRDLKLANILLSRNMAVKVGDFGLATRIDDDSMEPTTMCGTPSYISPEIMARQPYSFESDIWALGCLMVTLLTGMHPFRGINRITEDVVSRISLPRTVSSEARNLVYSLLRIDPRQRIRSQDLASHPFFSSLLSTVRLPTLTQIKQKMEQQQQQQQSGQKGGLLEGRDGLFNDAKYVDRILPPRHPDLHVDADGSGARRKAFHGGNAKRNAYGYVESEEPFQPTRGLGRHSRASAELPQTEYFNNRPQSMAGLGYRNRGGLNSNNIESDRHYSQAPATALNEDGTNRHANRSNKATAAAPTTTEAPGSVDLDTFTTRRLPPLKRAMKNGKVYLRADHLLVLDLTTVPTIVAMDEQLKEIYEFKRPLHIDSLCSEAAYRIYSWDLAALPERVSKTVRMACRCVSFLLSQQKRIKISTSQGKGWLFEDSPQATFKFSYFNGIKVELSRKKLEAVVEIPSKQDLPNEIQKIPLAADEFPAENDSHRRHRNHRNVDDLALDISDMSLNQKTHGDYANGRHRTDALDARIPGKIKGILDHVKEALRRVLDFNSVLREFEEDGSMRGQFEGEIHYPVELSWDWDITADLDYVPPGLQRCIQPGERRTAELRHQPGMLLAGRGLPGRVNGALRQSAMPISVSNTAGSTTVIASMGNNGRAARHGNSANHVLSRVPPISEQPEADDDYDVILDSPPVRSKRQRGNPAHGSHEQQQHQWGAHLLDQRTVNDTPTRRLNLGPITRLVEEFNKTTQPTPIARARLNNLMQTPGTVLRTPAMPGSRNAGDMAFLLAQQTFQGACFIPEVGWCMAAEGKDADDYAITILFCDGCRILVKVKDQVATYKDEAAEYTDLPFDHSMPARVKERLTWLPQFLGLMGLGI
ncbi:hypothetical protein IW140_003591 [Coemansia sp. RSA 1813]|nr:hypothetical protein LPJ74_004155 [Coemansia sp. RSA 1843]KAJ2089100.1 hypothetical protein IW138_003680 [Coemansia sp. RSA 986]KAJ2215642.1 hypothetical protein EV179_002053 [Coemansia sp. RSA 487]KAJ2568834.1 hypothetical protein IW140_003591 [Coemansia sp. RSA 1813]